MTRRIRVSAPSRLHFGMFSFGNLELPQFGGVGVMIDRPRVELLLHEDDACSATGPLSERAAKVAARVWEKLHRQESSPSMPRGYRLEIQAAPPEHRGLGVGTQLSLAITAGLLQLAERPLPTPAELARLAERGARSAVGAYGFVSGGLIVESGKLAGEAFSPLVAQLPLPGAWRFVLLMTPAEPHSTAGLSGERETAAFTNLPPVPTEVTAALCRETLLNLIPAAHAADFQRFSAALYRYGQLAGDCFASCQGGLFASRRLADLASTVRRLGVSGVGQSSWGPTLFALVESQAAATRLIVQLSAEAAADNVEFLITAPAAAGAHIQELAERPR